MISKKFLTSSFIYTVSSALSTVASFLLLPFYTNTSLLKISDFGALSLYIGLSLLIQVFTNFSIDYYIGVVYHEMKDDPAKLKSKIASLNGYMISIGIAIALLFAIGGDFFIKHYIDNPHPQAFRYVMMSVFTGIFTAHFKFYNALLLHRGKHWRYFWSNILNFVSTIVITISVLQFYPLTLEGPLWGRLLSCACIFSMSFIDVTYNYGIALKKEFIKPTLQFCFPFLVTTFFQWILSYSDRYIIKPLLHNNEVAIFDLAVRLTLLVNFLIDGLNSAISPYIFNLLREPASESRTKELNKYLSAFNLVTLLAIPLNIVVLPLILPLFINDVKYLEAFVYFGIVCSGFAVRGITNLYMFPVLFQRKTAKLIVINGLAAVIQIGMGFIMIRYFKLYGAAFTLIFVKVALVAMAAWWCRDMWLLPFNVMKMVVLPTLTIAVICLGEVFISSYGLTMHIVHFIESVLIITVCMVVYSSELMDLYRSVLKKAV